MVSYASKHVRGFSDKAATLGESAVTGKGESISPRPEISEFDGIAVVDRHFSAKGFSEETRKLLALSWRKGTRKDYTAKFKQFSMWCTEQKVDPCLASLNDCADFLTSLFSERTEIQSYQWLQINVVFLLAAYRQLSYWATFIHYPSVKRGI